MKDLSKTKIICTIGPETSSKEALGKLMNCGMSIARVNFSHGDIESHLNIFNNIKYVRHKHKRFVGIAMDTRGPELRTIMKNDMLVKNGDTIKFVSNINNEISETSLYNIVINLKNNNFLNIGDEFYIDDTKLKLKVLSLEKEIFTAEAQNTHLIKPNKRISFPNHKIPMEFLTLKDKQEIEIAVNNGADIVFVSFVEDTAQIKQIREIINDNSVQVIAKIETKRGLEQAKNILEIADGIMIARGDLATNVGIESLFSAQKSLTILDSQKILIMATEMMSSMISNNTPTRSEISDVGNAVLDGCDCVMLSAETAAGSYPYLCTDIMRQICLDAEKLILPKIIEEIHYIENPDDMKIKRKYIMRKGHFIFEK